ncbi:hypothetical protein L228DRAFT_249242 [Xylona heveae TC161]|uniref:N-acetyltransferase domain-containing protein n=1 Tax=Xylona heveae (strain CBS 132557 / TC161) TaxID=1328760 RepID=A0A165FVC7_XYLHT|nr:hypothetical protein L228DRAFT_249242 [Xylona heveae TC161]KZF21425.1 hypothetical protein L228DRAFT_249242 [Xylona heveae TC161]
MPNTELRQTQEWVDMILDRVKNGRAFNFTIQLKSTSPSQEEDEVLLQNRTTQNRLAKVIGLVGAPMIPEVGYILHPAHWGQGYATEALQAFLRLYWKVIPPGQQEGGYDYAEAHADPENVSSIKVLRKCGFSFIEKREKDVELPLMGVRDTAVFRVARPKRVTQQSTSED